MSEEELLKKAEEMLANYDNLTDAEKAAIQKKIAIINNKNEAIKAHKKK